MYGSPIIGYRRNGSPIRLIAGGSEPSAEQPPAGNEGQQEQEPQAKESGKSGEPTADDIAKLQAALDKERDSRKAAEKRAKDNDSYRTKVEELEKANQSETERAVEAARREGEAAATTKGNARLVAAEARALAAASEFRDASVAVRLLDLSDIDVNDDGVDTKAVQARLNQLATDNPYLLKDKAPIRPSGDVGQGPRTPTASEVAPGMSRIREAYALSSHK